jgi:hypothetical protein
MSPLESVLSDQPGQVGTLQLVSHVGDPSTERDLGSELPGDRRMARVTGSSLGQTRVS